MRHSFRWTAPALLLILAGAARPAGPTPFSLILERNGDTWHATCESGCTWDEVSGRSGFFSGARVRIDNTGIAAPATNPDSAATFAFTVETDGPRGWKATGLRGTSWTTVGFTCAMAGCRARLTKTGVTGI